MSNLSEFSIMPVLGRKTDVPADDPTLLRQVTDTMALSHDTGGINFDLARQRNACSKCNGQAQWSNFADAQATKCLGLFELYDGTNRNHVIFDNGKAYYYDSDRDPQNIDAATPVTFANDDADLYSIIKVGTYIVFADHGEHTPYKWQDSDANLTKLIASGTEYKFRYLVNFSRRVIGLYCPEDTDAPDISVRWSTSWPGTAITALNFPAANQLYIPNDDTIVGGATMGTDRCFIYSENSIHQLVYYPDYETPFRCYTTVPSQGATSHHSIVNLGYAHAFFNKNYGFCLYSGGQNITPISTDIDNDIADIILSSADRIVGRYIPTTRSIVWLAPMAGSTTPNRLLFYHIDNKTWWWTDIDARYIDFWQAYSTYTWQDLIRDLGGLGKASGTATTNTASHLIDSAADFVSAGVAVGDEAHNTTDGTYANVTAVSATDLTLDSDAFPDGNEKYEVGLGATWNDAGNASWASFSSLGRYLMHAGTDGHVYSYSGEKASSGNLDGYRVEPVLSFGNPKRKDLLTEIWFSIVYSASFSINLYHRSGDTLGELLTKSWTSLGSISCDNNAKPFLPVANNARLHQIKWGTDSNSERFVVNKITFKYTPQSEN